MEPLFIKAQIFSKTIVTETAPSEAKYAANIAR